MQYRNLDPCAPSTPDLFHLKWLRFGFVPSIAIAERHDPLSPLTLASNPYIPGGFQRTGFVPSSPESELRPHPQMASFRKNGFPGAPCRIAPLAPPASSSMIQYRASMRKPVGWLLLGSCALSAADNGESLFRIRCAPRHGLNGHWGSGRNLAVPSPGT